MVKLQPLHHCSSLVSIELDSCRGALQETLYESTM